MVFLRVIRIYTEKSPTKKTFAPFKHLTCFKGTKVLNFRGSTRIRRKKTAHFFQSANTDSAFNGAIRPRI
jgi:hypothetical protein